MKKLLIFLLATLALSACEQPVVDENPSIPMPPNNEIWYTSSDNDVVIPNDANVFGANIVNNSYIDGKGVMTFDGDVTLIGEEAFLLCGTLTSITIPDSVTSVYSNAFEWCTSLGEFKGKFAEDNGRILVVTDDDGNGFLAGFARRGVTVYSIPDCVTTIGGYVFHRCENLTSVTIGDSVTAIGGFAFAYCNSLTSVTIPDSVTEIGGCAFSHCTSLTSVTIPDSVYFIHGHAFEYCTNLSSVTIGSSVMLIAYSTFKDCKSLINVYCKATTPPSLSGTDVFDNNGSGRKIYVPAESVDAYKSATDWSEYASAIVGYDFENGVVVE
jgi:hypothetical protein